MVRRKSRASRFNNDEHESERDSPNKKRRKSGTIQVVINQDSRMQMTRKMYRTIRKLQGSVEMIIPRLPFSRLIREILLESTERHHELRIQSNALQALQEAAELYMVNYFEDAYLCTLHAKRKTLMINDMYLTRRLRGRQDIINH